MSKITITVDRDYLLTAVSALLYRCETEAKGTVIHDRCHHALVNIYDEIEANDGSYSRREAVKQ
jgi:hypothetical protein